jgi:Na+/melibiose symporter-like transporter
MKSKQKMTSKRILAIILGIILIIFAVFMLGSFKDAGDTKGTLLMVFGFMTTLGIALLLFGFLGGKEPQIGIIPKKESDPEEKEE